MSDDHRRVLVIEDDQDLARARRGPARRRRLRRRATPRRRERLRRSARAATTRSSCSTSCCRKRNGFSVCQDLRNAGVETPLLMLTAKDGELDEVEGLEVGADDFLRKPFERVDPRGAHPRAAAPPRAWPARSGSSSARSSLDPMRRSVDSHERDVTLTPREFALLEYLMSPRRAESLAKTEILNAVWGRDFDGDPNIVEVYIGYLRRKIDLVRQPSIIRTVRGVGYCVREELMRVDASSRFERASRSSSSWRSPMILVFTGVALVSLVHHSLETQATNQIEGGDRPDPGATVVVEQLDRDDEVVRPAHATATSSSRSPISTGTRVWAASSAIADAPVLRSPGRRSEARANGSRGPVSTPTARHVRHAKSARAQVGTITTTRGPGLIFGFVYGGRDRAQRQRAARESSCCRSRCCSFISGGLIWLGIGLALAPVESIRRRVDAIAAQDLTERVPLTGGDDEIARMARTVNAMLDRLEVVVAVPTGVRVERQSRAAKSADDAARDDASGRPAIPSTPIGPRWPRSIMREGRRLDVLIDDLFWLARHDEHQVPRRSESTSTSTTCSSKRPSASVR